MNVKSLTPQQLGGNFYLPRAEKCIQGIPRREDLLAGIYDSNEEFGTELVRAVFALRY